MSRGKRFESARRLSRLGVDKPNNRYRDIDGRRGRAYLHHPYITAARTRAVRGGCARCLSTPLTERWLSDRGRRSMTIRSFVVGPAKGLKHTAGDNLPNLVVIAGPNGAGKSTLLHQLYVRKDQFIELRTRVIYLGPHRPWRKSTLTAEKSCAAAPRTLR